MKKNLQYINIVILGQITISCDAGWLDAFLPEVYSELRCCCLRNWMRKTERKRERDTEQLTCRLITLITWTNQIVRNYKQYLKSMILMISPSHWAQISWGSWSCNVCTVPRLYLNTHFGMYKHCHEQKQILHHSPEMVVTVKLAQ